ncbi:MFS transporter [Marinicauda pacifica]|jgi:MFS family permease|uniref:MFS transporter n=1 Tax=Marinicauda pacifica TaxID=1133559 RepID=A0A4S2H988_9PROT|nr:MFS transporter [Marinicauda pacifica]TGY92417.1 MFS transporter [Marinicauda pacifica]GGE48754.1 MFS transporter [Marinicauda pacifica]
MTARAADIAPAARPGLGYAWYTTGVLTVCYTLSFIDRQILSLLVGPIKAEFNVSDTQVGLLGGLAFALFYSVLSLPAGRLVDRFNRRNIIAAGVFFWSLMTALCAVVRGYPGLFMARMGVGVGEATLAPAAVSMISDSFPNEKLGGAMSFYGVGIYLGSGLALLVGGLVVELVTQVPTLTLPVFGEIASWRATFLIVGVPGLLMALWVLTLKEPPRKRALLAQDGAAARLNIADTIVEVRRRWVPVGSIALGLMFQAIALYAFMLWSPGVLQRSFDWAPQQTGLVMGVLVLTCGSLGMLAGGRLSDQGLIGGHRDGALRVACYSSVVGTAAFVGLVWAQGESASATVAAFAVGVFLLAMPAGSCYAASQMVLPNQVRGQALALILFIANLGGLTLGPLLPGLLNDFVFGSESALGLSLGLTLSGSTLFAALSFGWGRSEYRRHHEALNP